MKKNKSFLIHIGFLVLAVCIVLIVIYRIKGWGTRIDLNSIVVDDTGQFDTEVYDNIMPLTDAGGYIVHQDVKKILLFGNDACTQSAGKKDSIARLMEEETGAEVVNLAVTGSYLASESIFDFPRTPMDFFTPYVLSRQLLGIDETDNYAVVKETLGRDLPKESDTVFETAKNIDMNTVDMVVFFYDDTDYRKNHNPYDPENLTNILACSGNLAATVLDLKAAYPQIRFVVLGPYYAYYVNEEGKYEDPDLHPNSHCALSGYSLWLYSVCSDRLGITFVDNYYGTVTISNAPKYLKDERTLNKDGRKLICERFLYAKDFYESWETEEG